jgi:hypothetical protein
MARQSRTINSTARNGWPDSAHAFRNLERVANVARKNIRVTQAAANIALTREYRWQLPAHGSLSNDEHSFETGLLLQRRAASDGSRSGLVAAPNGNQRDNRMKIARAEAGWSRTAAMVDAGARLHREISDLSGGLSALLRAERSRGWASAGRAISDGRKYAELSLRSKTDPTSRARESLEGRRLSFGPPDLPANVRIAPSSPGVIPPTNISQREFARRSSVGRVSNAGSGRAGITINSSPTVVINAPAGRAAQDDLIGALRAHREELFDQLKREAARRERAQF